VCSRASARSQPEHRSVVSATDSPQLSTASFVPRELDTPISVGTHKRSRPNLSKALRERSSSFSAKSQASTTWNTVIAHGR
jgi:hypothetical protein